MENIKTHYPFCLFSNFRQKVGVTFQRYFMDVSLVICFYRQKLIRESRADFHPKYLYQSQSQTRKEQLHRVIRRISMLTYNSSMSYMEGQLMTMASSFSSPTSKPFLPTPKSLLNPIPNRLIFNPKPAFGYLINRAKKIAIHVGGNNLHFPTEETGESFYCLLGVSEAATLLDIKKAYKQLVLKYHPDVSPLESAQECTRMFIRIQEAYETLSDPATRALYDTDYTYGFHIAFSPQKAYHSRPPPQVYSVIQQNL